MRIAQIAPMYEAVPPRLYGGTERVVAHLTDALVRQGHEVTLFSSADARTSAALVATRAQSLRLDSRVLKSDLACHLSMLHAVRRRERPVRRAAFPHRHVALSNLRGERRHGEGPIPAGGAIRGRVGTSCGRLIRPQRPRSLCERRMDPCAAMRPRCPAETAPSH